MKFLEFVEKYLEENDEFIKLNEFFEPEDVKTGFSYKVGKDGSFILKGNGILGGYIATMLKVGEQYIENSKEKDNISGISIDAKKYIKNILLDDFIEELEAKSPVYIEHRDYEGSEEYVKIRNLSNTVIKANINQIKTLAKALLQLNDFLITDYSYGSIPSDSPRFKGLKKFIHALINFERSKFKKPDGKIFLNIKTDDLFGEMVEIYLDRDTIQGLTDIISSILRNPKKMWKKYTKKDYDRLLFFFRAEFYPHFNPKPYK